MRLVVVSDSHGSWGNLFEAINRESSADAVYFLGDGYKEFDELACAYSDKFFFINSNGTLRNKVLSGIGSALRLNSKSRIHLLKFSFSPSSLSLAH